MTPRKEVFFLPGREGERFCLLTHAAEPVGALLFVHAFGEEMNKSRRMVALAAQAFAAGGWSTLQVDLSGCGDSQGDFGDASWAAWVQDVQDACAWLKARFAGPLVLWGLRSGALVLAEGLRAGLAPSALLLWQPVTNGRQHLTQFLRLKAAGEMLAEADAKASMESIRADLKAGQAVDVAGYRLSPALALGLEGASLAVPNPCSMPVVAFEVGPPEREDVSPALRILIERWVAAGVPAQAATVVGPAFWQTQEIAVCPALVDASLRALEAFR